MRGALKSFGVRIKNCSTLCFDVRQTESIPAELQAVLSPLLKTLAGLTATIKAYDKKIERLSRERYPETKLQHAGVWRGSGHCALLRADARGSQAYQEEPHGRRFLGALTQVVPVGQERSGATHHEGR